MESVDFENKNLVNVKTNGQLRGMVIILRGLIGEALKTMEAHIPHLGENYNYLRQAQTHLAHVDTANIEFSALVNVWLSLDKAVKHDTAFNVVHDLIKSAFNCADEMIADMPIPFSTLKPILTESIQTTLDEMVRDGLVEDIGNGRYRNTPAGQAYVNSLEKPNKLPHGTRVKLTIDFPEGHNPYYAGDLGTVDSSYQGLVGVRFDRNEATIAYSRLLDGVTIQVIDYCVPVDSETTLLPDDDTQEIPELQNPKTAFDNTLVTGDVKYGGDWHRCLEIARECLRRELWDGKKKFHICGDIQAVHRHTFFLGENPEVSKTYGPWKGYFCYINCEDVPDAYHACDDDDVDIEALLRDLDDDTPSFNPPDKNVVTSELAGTVVAVRKLITRNNETMAVITINYQQDTDKQMEVVFFPRTWAATKEMFRKSRVDRPEPIERDFMQIIGTEDRTPGYLQLICTMVLNWHVADEACAKCGLFTPAQGNLCDVCAEFAEVDNGN